MAVVVGDGAVGLVLAREHASAGGQRLDTVGLGRPLVVDRRGAFGGDIVIVAGGDSAEAACGVDRRDGIRVMQAMRRRCRKEDSDRRRHSQNFLPRSGVAMFHHKPRAIRGNNGGRLAGHHTCRN
jgi:hypothetical protein